MAKKKGKKKWIIIAIVVILIILAIIGKACLGGSGTDETPTATLSRDYIASTISASGSIESGTARNVINMTGLEVVTVDVEDGDYVNEGDILAVLDTKDLDRDLSQAALNVKNAQNTLDEAKKTNSQNVETAQIALDSAVLELTNARNNYEKLMPDINDEIAVQNAKLNLDRAQKAYDDAVTDEENNVQINSAQLDYDFALQNYKKLKDDEPAEVKLAEDAYDNAKVAYNESVTAVSKAKKAYEIGRAHV
jgi:multidrug efflux pump subunit AcrA (membrane-fusion protein)